MKNLICATAALLAALGMASTSHAANCSSYPYTLTNGQVADATQVMANFNSILSCANSNLAHSGANSDITSLLNVTLNGTTIFGGDITTTGNLTAGAASSILWTGRSSMASPADGSITLFNNAQTAFSFLQFGGVTSSFPSLKRSGTGLVARLADDSANAPFTAAAISGTTGNFTGTLTGVAGTFSGEVTTPASTTGAAGLNVPHGAAPTAPVNGDIWTTTSGLFVRVNGATQGPIRDTQLIEVQNKQTSGTNNPETGFTQNTWNHRTLNTVITNTISGASLSANQITLPAGTYAFTINGGSLAVGGTAMYAQQRLYDYTASAVLSVANAHCGGVSCSPSLMFNGTFTLAASHAVGLDINNAVSSNITDYGVALSFGPEVYATVVIQKIG